MKLERLDPMGMDDRLAEQLADVTNAEIREDAPDTVPTNGASFRGRAQFTHDFRPFDGFWVARDGDGAPIGHASIELPQWSNPRLAVVFCAVAPSHRGQGVGSALLDAQIDAARAAGRSMLLTFPTTDSPAQKLLQSRGFEVAQQAAQRRLLPQRLDYADLANVARDATDQASDYELVRLHGPAPDEWIRQLGRLFEALNDAPLDGIDLEPDLFPDERVRRYEQALAARGQDVYRLMARHRPTGELAGHTIVCVDRCRPGYANQEDTAVLPAHRGHRLGLLLKSSMLMWLRDAEPDLRVIDTWNAESNAHMIAVNDRLGSRVSGRATAVQLHLT